MQCDTRGVHNCANSTCVASSRMVSNLAEVPCGIPSVTIKALSAAASIPLQQVTPSLPKVTATASHMENISNATQQKAKADLPN